VSKSPFFCGVIDAIGEHPGSIAGGKLMNTNLKLALSVLAGVAMGVAGATAIQAQHVKMAPAYVISEIEVTDAMAFQKYAEGVPATLAPFNGHYLVRGGTTQAVEGDAPKRIVVIAFDSLERARGWEDSPAYEEIKPIRHNSAKSRIFIAEGVVPQ
jgi:uncharacterized protein (DUF1330 family)